MLLNRMTIHHPRQYYIIWFIKLTVQLTGKSTVSGMSSKKLTMFTVKNGMTSGLVSSQRHEELPQLNFQCCLVVKTLTAFSLCHFHVTTQHCPLSHALTVGSGGGALVE